MIPEPVKAAITATASADAVKLLWLAIVNIEDKQARERGALHELDGAYPGCAYAKTSSEGKFKTVCTREVPAPPLGYGGP